MDELFETGTAAVLMHGVMNDLGVIGQRIREVGCRPCGWTGTVRVYWTITTETWICPRCLEADETAHHLEPLASC